MFADYKQWEQRREVLFEEAIAPNVFVFFFSSRRRHTRCSRDWSSDVCSSDLLVVVGNGRRLAIECDGEQFHGPEKLQEDLEREAVLMRLGWTFERVRGSLFFR